MNAVKVLPTRNAECRQSTVETLREALARAERGEMSFVFVGALDADGKGMTWSYSEGASQIQVLGVMAQAQHQLLTNGRFTS